LNPFVCQADIYGSNAARLWCSMLIYCTQISFCAQRFRMSNWGRMIWRLVKRYKVGALQANETAATNRDDDLGQTEMRCSHCKAPAAKREPMVAERLPAGTAPPYTSLVKRLPFALRVGHRVHNLPYFFESCISNLLISKLSSSKPASCRNFSTAVSTHSTRSKPAATGDQHCHQRSQQRGCNGTHSRQAFAFAVSEERETNNKMEEKYVTAIRTVCR